MSKFTKAVKVNGESIPLYEGEKLSWVYDYTWHTPSAAFNTKADAEYDRDSFLGHRYKTKKRLAEQHPIYRCISDEYGYVCRISERKRTVCQTRMQTNNKSNNKILIK